VTLLWADAGLLRSKAEPLAKNMEPLITARVMEQKAELGLRCCLLIPREPCFHPSKGTMHHLQQGVSICHSPADKISSLLTLKQQETEQCVVWASLYL
jgi:hypothetical protein